VVLAFGHGHVGLVAGPRTGRVVAAMLAGLSPEVPVAAFDPGRFR
jgi:D-amino-acid dehydrogenase